MKATQSPNLPEDIKPNPENDPNPPYVEPTDVEFPNVEFPDVEFPDVEPLDVELPYVELPNVLRLQTLPNQGATTEAH